MSCHNAAQLCVYFIDLIQRVIFKPNLMIVSRNTADRISSLHNYMRILRAAAKQFKRENVKLEEIF